MGEDPSQAAQGVAGRAHHAAGGHQGRGRVPGGNPCHHPRPRQGHGRRSRSSVHRLHQSLRWARPRVSGAGPAASRRQPADSGACIRHVQGRAGSTHRRCSWEPPLAHVGSACGLPVCNLLPGHRHPTVAASQRHAGRAFGQNVGRRLHGLRSRRNGGRRAGRRGRPEGRGDADHELVGEPAQVRSTRVQRPAHGGHAGGGRAAVRLHGGPKGPWGHPRGRAGRTGSSHGPMGNGLQQVGQDSQAQCAHAGQG